MRTVALGHTGAEVSVLALGTMTFGTLLDRETCSALLDCYREHGGNLIDTANMYAFWLAEDPAAGGGQAETEVGAWLRDRGCRDELLIASKVGNPTSSRQRTSCLKASYMVEECEKSLRRLGVDTVDLYYFHVEDRSTPLEESLEAFERLRLQGKVRFIGASGWRVWRLEQARACQDAQGWERFCCIQNQFSYLQPYVYQPGIKIYPRVDAEVRDFAEAYGLTIFAWEPVCRGAYFDRTRLDAEKFDYRTVDNLVRLDTVERVARDIGATPIQVVLAWMLHGRPAVHPIVAADTVAQLEEDLAASSLSLDEATMQRLDTAPRIKD